MRLGRAILFSLALPTLVAAQRGEAPVSAVINVTGIAVVRETFDSDPANPYKPFGLESGTRLGLAFRLPNQRIVCFDHGDSTVESMVDDQGTNLMALSHRLQVPGFLGHGCGVLEDGRVAHVEIFGGTAPVPGATMIQTRGKAVFFTGSTSAKATSPMFRAAKGAKINAGGRFDIEMARWDAGGIAGKGANVTLRLDFHPASFQSVQFVGADNTRIESRPAGMAVEGTGDKRVFLLHYQLAAMPENLSIEIDYWSDVQRIEIPFDVKAGLGGTR